MENQDWGHMMIGGCVGGGKVTMIAGVALKELEIRFFKDNDDPIRAERYCYKLLAFFFKMLSQDFKIFPT